MKLVYTDTFKKNYKKLPTQVQEQLKKQMDLFLENPKHPSLHIKKMKGHSDI
jgi:mRNA interferase RelE/StbE